jgi:TP901 family phage tail tape measure protein
VADAQTTIDLIFNGVDKTGAATQAALKNVQGFGDSIKTATQPIADFTVGALKLEAALLSAGGAIIAFSVSAAADFQSALTDLNKVLGDSDNINQYKDLAIELGQAYGIASEDVLRSITNYKTAGFSAKEAGELTKAGLDLVIAGNVDAVESSNLLVASLKGFGLEASASAGFVDLLNTVSNDYAVTTGQLLEGFAELSPVAKLAGLSLQETIGILTPGIEVFQSGSEVANALKSSLLFLISDAKPVQEALSAIGVAQKDANGELRLAGDIYFDVAEALNGLSENQRIYFAEQLVGKNRAAEFLATIAGLGTTMTIAGDEFQYLGSAAKEVAAQLATAESATNKAIVSLKNLAISIGTPLLEEFSGVADAVGAIFQAIGVSLNKGELDEIINFIEGRMRGLQSTLEAVAQNLPEALQAADLSGFIDGIDAISDAFSGIFDGIDLTSVDGLKNAIENVGAAFNYLSNYVAGVIDSFKPLANVLFDTSEGFKDIDAESARSAGELGGFILQLNLLAGPMTTVAASLLAFTQALKIGGSIASVTTALGAVGAGGLIGALSSLAAIGAAGGVGYGIGTLANELSELTTGNSLSTWATDALIGLGLLDDGAGDIVANLNNVDTGLKEIVVTAKRIGEVDGPDQLNDSLEEVTVTARMWGETAAEAARRQEIAAASSEKWAKGLDYTAPLFDIMTGKVIGFAEATGGIDKAMGAATDATKAFNLEAEKLQSAEAIAIIEANSATMVARIEADAAKTVAAFESITVSIQSTGETLTSMYGLLGDDNISKLDKLGIKKQIAEEAEARKEAFRLQERLTEAQIKALNAQAAALTGGDPLITINGDGLAPHLEAMMFEVLKAIQVRVNSDGYAMLLGAAE